MKTKIRKQESEFKAEIIKEWLREGVYAKVFCIESEETIPGFPDTLCHTTADRYDLWEFKSSDEYGVITFKKSQPRFYLENSSLDIWVLAYNNKTGVVHEFPVSKLFEDGPFKMSSSRRVRLPL